MFTMLQLRIRVISEMPSLQFVAGIKQAHQFSCFDLHVQWFNKLDKVRF